MQSLALTIAVGALAVASIASQPPAAHAAPSAAGITGCVSNRTRALTISTTGACPSRTTKLNWQVTGPPGLAGAPGGGTLLSQAEYRFRSPAALAFDGQSIWVAHANGDSVTEIRASDAFIRRLSGGRFRFASPSKLLADHDHIWVADHDDAALIEINASTGAFMRRLSGSPYDFHSVVGLAGGGGHIWVANGAASDTVTELSASTGAFVRTLSGHRYGFAGLTAITSARGRLWVISHNGGMTGGAVTELNARTGAFLWHRGNTGIYFPRAAVTAGGTS